MEAIKISEIFRQIKLMQQISLIQKDADKILAELVVLIESKEFVKKISASLKEIENFMVD